MTRALARECCSIDLWLQVSVDDKHKMWVFAYTIYGLGIYVANMDVFGVSV